MLNDYQNLEQSFPLYKGSERDVYFGMNFALINSKGNLELCTLKVVFIADDLDLFEQYFDIKFLYVVFSITGRCIYRYIRNAWNNINYYDKNIFEYSPQKYPEYTLIISIKDIIKVLTTIHIKNFLLHSSKYSFISEVLINESFARPEQNEKGHLSYLIVVDDIIEQVYQKDITLYIASPYDFNKLKESFATYEMYRLYSLLIQSDQFSDSIEAKKVKEYVISRNILPKTYNYIYTPEYTYISYYNGIQLLRIFSLELASNLLYKK